MYMNKVPNNNSESFNIPLFTIVEKIGKIGKITCELEVSKSCNEIGNMVAMPIARCNKAIINVMQGGMSLNFGDEGGVVPTLLDELLG